MIINPSTLTSGIKVIPSDSINIPGPVLKFDGVTTADLASKLQDTTAPLRGGFVQTLKPSPNENQVLNQGVQVGDVVYNMSAARPGIAYVTAVDSNNTLSLSADIFPNAGSTRDAYSIFEGNGINVNQDWGFKLVVGSLPAPFTSNQTAGFNNATDQAIVPSGGTYTGNATFTMTVSGGNVTGVKVATTGDFDQVDPAGKTIIFSNATIDAVFGGGGTGFTEITFKQSDTTYVNEPKGFGQSKGFQIYIGGTGGDVYVTTNMGKEVFIESVPAGTILPLVVARVNVGEAAAGGNGNKNTLTSATEIVALT